MAQAGIPRNMVVRDREINTGIDIEEREAFDVPQSIAYG